MPTIPITRSLRFAYSRVKKEGLFERKGEGRGRGRGEGAGERGGGGGGGGGGVSIEDLP